MQFVKALGVGIGVIALVVLLFFVSLIVDFAVVGLASAVSGIHADFRVLLGAAILLAAAQSSVNAGGSSSA